MKQQNARIIDSLLAAGVVVVAIVICAVLIMQPEDVMPSVVTVTAGWEKGSQVRSNWHAIDDPVTNVVVQDSFMADFLRDGWQVRA